MIDQILTDSLGLLALLALLPLLGTVNLTTVLDGETKKIVDVEATADADTQAVITHSQGDAPLEVYLTPLAAAARISDWIVTGITTTQVTLGKTTTASSGAAGAQVKCIIADPHTIVR